MPYPAVTNADNPNEGRLKWNAAVADLDVRASSLEDGSRRKVLILASPPDPELVNEYIDSGTGVHRYWDGSGWVGVAVGSHSHDDLYYTEAETNTLLAAKASTSDPRFTDERTPTDSSVTNAKVAAGAAIAESKLNLASDAVAGTASRRTLGTGAQQAAAGNDSRLSDQRVPTDSSVTLAKIASSIIDALASTASLRTLGTGAQQAAAGNDSRLSDQRTPTDGSVTAAKMATTNKGVVICTSTTRPASPVEGQLIYETDTDNVMKNTGTPASPSWQNVSGAASSNPTGTILPYAGSAAPSGYLICNGSEFLSATYPDLAALLGTTWGTAAAGNTKLPDLRGRTLIGAGTGSGLTARILGQQTIGAETHLLTSAESGVPAHTHNVPSGQNTVARTSSGANTAGISAGSTDANTAADASSAHNNMQPSAVVTYIIKT